MSDKIISWNIGNFAILITRKQLLGAFLFALFAIIFFVFFSSINLERGSKFLLNLDFIEDKYEDFKKHCSVENYVKNPTHTGVYCQARYRYSDVSWSGYVIRVDYDDQFFARHRLSILIRMDKELKGDESDFYLKFSDYQYDQYKDGIFNLTRGDSINFNATFLYEGDARSSPMLECFGIEKGLEHINLEPHIHHSGRIS
jgi:hypothetical protein